MSTIEIKVLNELSIIVEVYSLNKRLISLLKNPIIYIIPSINNCIIKYNDIPINTDFNVLLLLELFPNNIPIIPQSPVLCRQREAGAYPCGGGAFMVSLWQGTCRRREE